MAESESTAEINRLYWQTDASVSEIADRVDVSRRALYDAIDPRPAGADCPECGAPLGFRNRTALENREAECPECGYEEEMAAPPADSGMDSDWDASDKASEGTARLVPPAGSGPFVSFAFVLGMVVGALLIFSSRKS